MQGKMKLLLGAFLAASVFLTASADTVFPALKQECKAALERLVQPDLVKTAKVRKVLVFYRCEGFVHGDSIVTGNEAFRLAAERTKAFTVDFSQDYNDLRPENLKKYDVLVLSSTTGLKTKENAFLEPAFVQFVENGGGLLAIHAGADCWNDAPGAANVVGGLFAGHPWGAGGTWAFKVEDTSSALTQSFKNPKFKQGEEIYQHKSPPFNRAKVHVLLSLDMDDPVTNGVQGKIRPEENDYPVSWVRPYGKGRVFYTSFGHDTRAWTTEQTLRHIFAGLAFAAGDLKADMTQAGLNLDSIKKMENPAEIAQLLRDVVSHGGSAELAKRTVAQIEKLANDQSVSAAVREGAQRALPGNSAAYQGLERRRERPEANTAWAKAAAEAIHAMMEKPEDFVKLVKNPDERVRLALIGHDYGKKWFEKVPVAAYVQAYGEATTARTKAALLTRLAERNAPEVVKLAEGAVASEDEVLAVAALDALRKLGGAADVELILKARARGGDVARAAELAIADMSAPGVSAKLFELAAKDKDLLGLIAKRMESATIANWKPFVASPDKEVRRAAWRALRNMASAKTLAAMCAWMPLVQAEDVTVATAALKVSAKNADDAARTSAMVAAWQQSPAAGKRAVAPVMALTPNAEFMKALVSGLKDGDKDVKKAAAAALAAWNDLAPEAALLAAYQAEGDAEVKTAEAEALVKLCANSGRDKLLALFKAFAEADRLQAVRQLYVGEGIAAFDALEKLFADPVYGASAKKGYLEMYDILAQASEGSAGKPLDRASWKASASANNGNAKNAIDGNENSRWDTGHSTKEGEWFQLDLGSPSFLSEATLDTTKSANDTPAGCDVFVSADGKAWNGPVATCDDKTKAKTTFQLNAPGRYVKFVVKGGKPGLYWSIHEIELKSGVSPEMLKAVGEKAAKLR